ncbi:MAG: BadF/BadG/BcrA/BcrD ATPase family protein [Bryobacteraceae bacterium]
MKLFLGVDGGQSSTTAMVGDEGGRVLGVGRGGPCNHVTGAGAREKFIRAIGGAVSEACAAAGLAQDDRDFEAGCFGFSGGAEDKQALIEEMFRFGAGGLEVTHDGRIALSGAMAGGPGIIVIAGTGSISFGRGAAGKMARAGGWGYVFGDEGGAFDIARQALRASLRMEEGWGGGTALRRALLDATEAESANEMLHWFYRVDWPRSRIARLAPLVDEAARHGDAAAREILHGAAQSLAMLAGAVRGQLFEEGEPVGVAWIGGVFQSEIVRARFQAVCELSGDVRCGAPAMGPAAGALLEAYRLRGLTVPLTNVPEMEK